MQIVHESPIIQELLTEKRQLWIKEGIEQGIERGQRKAKIESLGQILAIRLDVVLEEFDKPFETLDLQSLKALIEAALTVDTLAEFEDALTKMFPQDEANTESPDNSV